MNNAQRNKKLKSLAKEMNGSANDMAASRSAAVVAWSNKILGYVSQVEALIDKEETPFAEPIYKPGPRWPQRPKSAIFAEHHDRFLIDTEGLYRNFEALAPTLGFTTTALSRRYNAIKNFA